MKIKLKVRNKKEYFSLQERKAITASKTALKTKQSNLIASWFKPNRFKGFKMKTTK